MHHLVPTLSLGLPPAWELAPCSPRMGRIGPPSCERSGQPLCLAHLYLPTIYDKITSLHPAFLNHVLNIFFFFFWGGEEVVGLSC